MGWIVRNGSSPASLRPGFLSRYKTARVDRRRRESCVCCHGDNDVSKEIILPLSRYDPAKMKIGIEVTCIMVSKVSYQITMSSHLAKTH